MPDKQPVSLPSGNRIQFEADISEIYIDSKMKPIYLDIYAQTNKMDKTTLAFLRSLDTNRLSEKKRAIHTQIGKCRVTIEFLEEVYQTKNSEAV